MRRFCNEVCGISRQNGRTRLQAKLAVDMAEAFHQPAAKEARAAGNEYPLPAHRFPQRLSLAQNVLKIAAGKWSGHALSVGSVQTTHQ